MVWYAVAAALIAACLFGPLAGIFTFIIGFVVACAVSLVRINGDWQ